MSTSRTRTLGFAALALALPAALFGQTAPDNTSAESQLRDALRAATLQLRTVQGELAAANAEKEQAAANAAELAKRLNTLAQQFAAAQNEHRMEKTRLETRIAAGNAESARLADRLKQAEDARDAAAELARTRAGELADSRRARTDLENTLSRLRSDNRELFNTGMEILERLENFGLGRAIAAREPFTRLSRVKLQTIIQDYQDKLEDKRLKLPSRDTAAPDRQP